MKKSDFKEAIKDLKLNDAVHIELRGYYENYTVTGSLFTLTGDEIGISEGVWHSYRRVIAIKKM